MKTCMNKIRNVSIQEIIKDSSHDPPMPIANQIKEFLTVSIGAFPIKTRNIHLVNLKKIPGIHRFKFVFIPCREVFSGNNGQFFPKSNFLKKTCK